MAVISNRAGRWLAPFAQILAIIFLLMNVLVWLIPEWSDSAARYLSHVSDTYPITLTTGTKLLGMVLSTLHLGILAYALFTIAKTFRAFATGVWLQPDLNRDLCRFGLALIAFGASTPIAKTLMTLIITLNNAPGKRQLAIGFSGNDFVIMLIGILMVMLAYAFKEALEIAEFNRQIV